MRIQRIVLSALAAGLLVAGMTGCYFTPGGVGNQSVESLSDAPQLPPVEVSRADQLVIPNPVPGEAIRLVHSSADPATTVDGSATAIAAGYQLVAACSVPAEDVVVAADTSVLVTLSESSGSSLIVADEVVVCDGNTHSVDAVSPQTDAPQLTLTLSGGVDQVEDAYAVLVPRQK